MQNFTEQENIKSLQKYEHALVYLDRFTSAPAEPYYSTRVANYLEAGIKYLTGLITKDQLRNNETRCRVKCILSNYIKYKNRLLIATKSNNFYLIN
jgi:hypothetical protein